jgi:RNA polymerase sigma factor (TIGR02999 family)
LPIGLWPLAFGLWFSVFGFCLKLLWTHLKDQTPKTKGQRPNRRSAIKNRQSALYYLRSPNRDFLRLQSRQKERSSRLSQNPTENVTRLLIELSKGDRGAVDLLLPVIYDELRKLAANYLRRERPDHTLQPTALVHEAYLRLVDQTRVNWQNRAHFFGVAAQIMRRLLVDHARKHNAEKRGQDFQKLSLDENIDRAVERSTELIALDDALRAFAEFDEQKARMVELRYFGGLSIEETADVLGVTPTTIKRHWRFAKAWLHGEMQRNN